MNGSELLAEFRKSGAEGAFRELVRRYTDLVYSTAKRRVNNGSMAEDATQNVFIKLAKAPPNLRGDAELVAWLHRTTVHASIDLWRSETRRRAREEHAAAMQTEPIDSSTWNEIAPIVDEALNALNDAERQVVLLRFFERKSMREVGMALGIGEDAAKMRVSRAMEHLREACAKRGATCGAVLLGGLLAEQAVEAAPAGLGLALLALPIPAAPAIGATAKVVGMLARASVKKFVAGAVIIAGVATVFRLMSTGGSSGTRAPNRAPLTVLSKTNLDAASLRRRSMGRKLRQALPLR